MFQLHQSFFTSSCHILVSLTNILLDLSVDTLQFIQLKSFQLALAFISGNVHIQISEVQSPPGNLKGLTTDMKWSNRGESNIIRFYRISWARTGPSGSVPKSTRKSLSISNPPFSVSTLILSKTDPFLTMQIDREWNDGYGYVGCDYLLNHFRIKLAIPRTEKRCGDVQPFTI